MIGYMIGCLIPAAVLTLFVSLVRPIKGLDTFFSWRWLLGFYLVALAAPYGYTEILTRIYGDPMEEAVERTMVGASNMGTLDYYKVFSCRDGKARVIAVGIEKSDWGGDERPVMGINLELNGDVWEAVEFNWVTSEQRSKDSITLPPYW
ncbi:MAG: hypothetical protein IH945_00345 [Armatimonadetes bacterium]|nr:hypothetical protein [Armatimonadota bacterium]